MKISKIAWISSASQPANQPYIRPGCTRCMAPEILHCKGDPVGFTKLLLR